MNKDRVEEIECDWNGSSCTQLQPGEINSRQGYGGKRCQYLNILNSGARCKGACCLKDYAYEEDLAVIEFHRKLASGEIVLRD